MADQETQTKSLEGYKAEQARDGTWSIYDVPIFSAHTDDRGGGDPIDFSKKWLEKAFRKALIRQEEGYLPPLHVVHHGDREPARGAGRFRLKRLGSVRHGGEEVPTLFADLVGIRESVYQEIRKGELPYRSVEILDYTVPEIDSLALLDHEVPYFRYALLTIGEEVTSTGRAQYKEESREGCGLVRHYRAKGFARAYSFNYATDEVKRMEMEEDKKVDKMDMGGDVGAKILEYLMKIMEKLGLEEEEEAEEMDAAPPAQMQAGPVEMGPPAEVQSADVVRQAEQRGEQAALVARLEAMEAELKRRDRETAFAAIATDLERRGFGPEHIRAFKKEAADHGLEAGRAFSRALILNGPQDPPSTWTGEATFAEADPKEVAAYSAKGPESLNRAREFHKSWKRTQSQVPLGEYLEMCFDPHGFMDNARRQAVRG